MDTAQETPEEDMVEEQEREEKEEDGETPNESTVSPQQTSEGDEGDGWELDDWDFTEEIEEGELLQEDSLGNEEEKVQSTNNTDNDSVKKVSINSQSPAYIQGCVLELFVCLYIYACLVY